MRHLAIGSYAVVLLALAAAPSLAQEAPPQRTGSTPEEGAMLHKAPKQVEVEFNQPLDDSSSLAVVDGCNRQLDDGSTQIDGNTMSVGIVKTPSGDYHVEYIARGVEGLTGESEGHFTFMVHSGQPCDDKQDDHEHGKVDEGDKHNDGDHGNSKHEGNEDGGHDANDQGSMEHTDDSATTAHTQHDEDGMGRSEGKHDGHARHVNEDRDNDTGAAAGVVPGITSSDTARELLGRADSGTLLAALALCVVLGSLGGVILRSSAGHRSR